jgi:hypothetical protein
MAFRRKSQSPPQNSVVPSDRRAEPSGKRRPGRPAVHDEAWTKVTVVLFDRQILFLDRLASSIRTRNGAAISRAQLIRAFVDAVGDSAVDVTASTTEADVKAIMLARLGRHRPPSP